MRNYKRLLLPIAFVCSSALFAQNIQNPVLPKVADAGVMKYNGKYYIGGVFTNGDFYVSDDLVHWGKPVHVVDMNNEWSKGTGAGNDQIHANDMFYLNGDFHLYWSVNYWGKDKHAVHTVHAQSDNVLGPYTEPNKKTWMDNRIDPKVFRDDDGQLYMYMVRFTDGNTIWGRKMKNPAEFAADPVCMFASLPDTWETMDNRVAEGPWVMKYRNRYYMMYNANHTSTRWGNYQLGVAEADSPLGFQNGNKYSYPLVGCNQVQLEESYVDLLRYSDVSEHASSYNPQFDYTENKPTVDWTKPSYETSNWKRGETGFSSDEIGNSSEDIKGSTVRHPGTKWTSPSLWLRKEFSANKQTGNLALRITHDGDTKIYLNGTLIYEKQGRDYCVVNLDKKQRAALKEGANLLAVETNAGRSHFFDVSLFDMKDTVADDILMTPGQPNILRGPNGFEWWLIYMANKNDEHRGQYINRVQFFDKTMFVDGITGPNTTGYHPEPALPTYSAQAEQPSLGILSQVQPATAYLFEAAVKTKSEAGIIAWWKDADNCVYVGLDAQNQCWYLRTRISGKESKEMYALPADFRWGVYHQLRIERNTTDLSIWLDEIPAPQKHLFTGIIPAEAGIPGTFDLGMDAFFEGVAYTIGFDTESIHLGEQSEEFKGELLNDYEFSFQLSGLADKQIAGSYPVYVDKHNYVKAQFNGITRNLEVTGVKKGKQVWKKDYPLEHLQTYYPDVKYTDFIEKTYRFASPVLLDALYLNRHEASNKREFVNDMFGKFTVDYLSGGEWHPIDNREAEVASEHPAYNRLSFTPIKAEGIRFINKDATDLQRHIYKIGVREQWKESYNFRTVRRGDKLYLFVDGRELGALDIQYPASRIGFCSESNASTYNGILYYHIEK